MIDVVKNVARIPVTAEMWHDWITMARLDAAMIGDEPPSDPLFATLWHSTKARPADMLAQALEAWPDHDWSEFL